MCVIECYKDVKLCFFSSLQCPHALPHWNTLKSDGGKSPFLELLEADSASNYTFIHMLKNELMLLIWECWGVEWALHDNTDSSGAALLPALPGHNSRRWQAHVVSPPRPGASFNQFSALLGLRHKGRVDIKPQCWQLQFSFRLLQTDCNFFNVEKIWKEGTCS